MTSLSRRNALKYSAAGVALLWLPAGCGGPDEGPGPIKLDRDACDFCGMIISEIRYAAEIRGGGDHRLYKFDDIGCAVHFTQRTLPETAQPATGPAGKFWVMNHEDGKTWLDARQATYRGGFPTPMAYGFAALKEGAPETVSFEAMKTAVLKRAESAPIITANAGGPR